MKRTLVAATLAAALACPGQPLADAEEACELLSQTTFVRDVLAEYYLWYEELPLLDPALFDSPEAYLDAVRYRPLDTSFSSVQDRVAFTTLLSDSQFVGLGFTSRFTGPTELRVALVYPDGPAAEAGLRRGDRIVAVGGRPLPDIIADGTYFGAFGPDVVGTRVEIAWSRDDEVFAAEMTKRIVTIPTVSLTRSFDVEGRRVGYLHFRNFVGPSADALDAAFDALGEAGVTELVLDLRYNGGGLVSTARHLAGLIGGARTSDEVFGTYRHNDKNRFRDSVLRFPRPDAALDLRRLVVITTGASASASELVINGLRPWIDIAVIGSRTFGKPVGQYSFGFCDRLLLPVSFQIVNADGEADYFGGIPVDCRAPDDLDHPMGDPSEASLAEALHYARTGECRAGGAVAASSRAPRPALSDWQLLLGAQ